MAQRRNSSGRGDDRSDLDDVKALAAKARETGGPVVKQNAAELSGVRPRRDSVIGMRLTPPPRTTSSELPNWFWGVLGCLTVLLVGFAALVFLGRSGMLGPLLAEVTPLVARARPTSPTASPPAEPAPPSVAVPTTGPARAEPSAREQSPRVEHAERVAAAQHLSAAGPSGPAPVGSAPTDPTANAAPTAPAADDEAAGAARHGTRDHATAAKARSAKAGESPGANDQDDNTGADTTEAKAPAAASRPAPAKAPAKAADDSSDDDSLPGQDAVEAALDALSSRVRGCFVKYQIKGTARVRLVATPAGTVESVSVTGDFEDTPTGLCVESVVSGAKLPTFKGPPLKLSQSYQLR